MNKNENYRNAPRSVLVRIVTVRIVIVRIVTVRIVRIVIVRIVRLVLGSPESLNTHLKANELERHSCWFASV